MVLQYLLLLLPVLMQTWLAALFIGRRLYRRFPFFFVYTSFSLLAELLRTLVQHDQWRFLYVYWTTEALYALLGFLAIYEAFRHVFRHFYVMWWWFRFLPAVIDGSLVSRRNILPAHPSPATSRDHFCLRNGRSLPSIRSVLSLHRAGKALLFAMEKLFIRNCLRVRGVSLRYLCDILGSF
jgi:hypothetical protein